MEKKNVRKNVRKNAIENFGKKLRALKFQGDLKIDICSKCLRKIIWENRQTKIPKAQEIQPSKIVRCWFLAKCRANEMK